MVSSSGLTKANEIPNDIRAKTNMLSLFIRSPFYI
jgi:hypothetical protein